MVVRPEERISLFKRLINDMDIKVLYWDLESSPNEGYFWSTGDNYITYKQIKRNKETKIITIQYMWEGDSKPSYLVWDRTKDGFDDSRMVDEFINKVMRKYDPEKLVIVGQNHKAFDHKLLNERAKVLRLTPPLHNMIKVDTYKQSKAAFKTASHGLDARSQQYGLGGKLDHNLQMWIDILEGRADPKDELIPYGLKDVLDLRAVMWNDLPYYEKLPAPLEKLLCKAKAKCIKCEDRKQSKYDVEECKVNGKSGWKCLNCGDKFTL